MQELNLVEIEEVSGATSTSGCYIGPDGAYYKNGAPIYIAING
ncbi:hypothetical protein ACO0LH_16465 [Undibacterium sp. TJN19]